MRSLKTVVQVVVVLAMAAVFFTVGGVSTATISPAGAQQLDQDRVAAVDVEVLRSSTGASSLPVRVTVVSRRALDARLVVESQNSNISWEVPLGLAANSEVSQLFVVPSQNGGGAELVATLFVDGVSVASARSDQNRDHDNAVGVLGLSAPASDVQLNPGVGKASLIEIDNLNILPALDTVVASPAGLRSLTPQEQASLLQWVSAGRQLAIADEPGSVDAILPDAWKSSATVVPAGTGFIRYIGVQWADGVPPGVTVASQPWVVGQFFDSSGAELLNDAGFRVPGLGFLALLLVAYLILAGPVTFGVLTKMRKQALAWIVLPALAVVFSFGVFGVGRMLTRGRGNGHATIVEVSPVGAWTSDTILIANSGRQSIELPEGWTFISNGLDNNFGQDGAPVTIEPTRTRSTARFAIDSGSGAGATFVGGNSEVGEVLGFGELRIEGSLVSGVVTNTSGSDLENVSVFVGDRMELLDRVDDGESAAFSIDLSRNANRFAPELNEWGVGNQGFNEFGRRNNNDITDGPTNGSAWFSWRVARYGSAVPEGLLTVAGWSRDLDLSQVDGAGRTALVAHAAVPTSNDALLPAQVRVVPMMVPGDRRFEGFDGPGRGVGAVSQFIRPADSDSSELALEVRGEVTELQVWVDDEGWRSFDIVDDTRRVAVPEAAWNTDVMTVRYFYNEFFGDPAQTRTNLLPVNNATSSLELLPAGDRVSRETRFDEPERGFQGEAAGTETVVELGDDDTFVSDGELFGTYDTWLLALSPGDVVTVEMKAGGNNFNNVQLDPHLIINGPNGGLVAENDDFNGLNSRVVFEAEVAGTYIIETRPLGGMEQGGSYQVTIEVEPQEIESAGEAIE